MCECGHAGSEHGVNGQGCAYEGCHCSKFRPANAAGPSAPVTLCPACGHAAVLHTSGKAGTSGCSAEGCSCGHSYQSARDLASDRKALPDPDAGHGAGDGFGGEDFPSKEYTRKELESLTAGDVQRALEQPKGERLDPRPLRELLDELKQQEQAKGPEEGARMRLQYAAEFVGDPHIPPAEGEGPRLRDDCRTVRRALDEAAMLSDHRPWHEAFEALDRLTRHAARTYLAQHYAGQSHRPAPARPESDGEWQAHWAFYQHTLWQRDQAFERERKLVDALQGTTERTLTVEAAPAETPANVVKWQREVCKAWASAIGLAGIMSSETPTLEVPTVTQLQDATGGRLTRATTAGVRTTARMWASALGLRMRLVDPVPTPEELIAKTEALVDSERLLSHGLQNVQNALDAHRLTLQRLQHEPPCADCGQPIAGGRTEFDGGRLCQSCAQVRALKGEHPFGEPGQTIVYNPPADLSPLVREFFAAYDAWRAVCHLAHDAAPWKRYTDAENALRASLKESDEGALQEPRAVASESEGPVPPALEESRGAAASEKDAPEGGSIPGSGETSDDIPF